MSVTAGTRKRPRLASTLLGIGLGLGAPLLAGWYGSLPSVRGAREWNAAGPFEPVPTESVRVLESAPAPGCQPIRILARLHVRGRLFTPSDESVVRAMRRRAGAVGANAVVYPPWRRDLPVLGKIAEVFAEVEADDQARQSEARVGRAIAVRCNVDVGGSSP